MIQFLFTYSRLLAVIWALIILALCSVPGQFIPSVSILELLSFDKWVHAGMFFVLCILVFFHFRQKTEEKRNIYVYLFLAVLYGCSLEMMQGTLFSNRSADWHDMIANTFGCVMAFVTYNRLYRMMLSFK